MTEGIVSDEEKGELRILGRRRVAIDVEAFCEHLESLVGPSVAEVVMNSHEYRIGREHIKQLRSQNPQATDREIIELLSKGDRLTGVGVVKVTLPENPLNPIQLEVSNPCVKETVGVGKALICTYWCGALSFLLGKELEAKNVTYDEERNLMKCHIVPRSAK